MTRALVRKAAKKPGKHSVKKSLNSATAFAPATVANVAVGFDILGFAINGLGETACVEKIPSAKVILNPIEGYPEIPLEPHLNTATAGLLELIKDQNLNFGFRVTLKKNIPMGSGLGGSSTSAVAALVAANALLKKKLSMEQLLHYALIGEQIASQSRHADNVAPCLVGGMVLIHQNQGKKISAKTSNSFFPIKIKSPKDLYCVIVLPEISIKTSEARKILSPQVPLASVIEQTRNLAGFILGCEKSDFDLMGLSLKDAIIETQRSHLVPFFSDIQKSALAAGALGCSLSGSGPAMFALGKGPSKAVKIHKAMLAMAAQKNLPIKGSWVSRISNRGARVIRGRG
ncbi:MAG: homoserine kinase [Deltaproteobacteria bacterium]|jgi:homoserine kinase|nr:homoserine kinase [Deltaproteobacteria bacterium]